MERSLRLTQPPRPKKLHDKVNEVRRRKEEAEKLVKERHEAVRRQHEEKILKINEERLRQQKELKERHAKELKKQQDVLQRRMALMERDNARRKEILDKNHAAVSRLVTSSSRKNYAFGSSTPREPSFLDCRLSKSHDRSLHEKQVSSTGAAYGHRGRNKMSEMSISMYVPSESSPQSDSVSKISNCKTTPVKSSNLMTQSVSIPSAKLCSTPVSRIKKPHNQHTNYVLSTSLDSESQSKAQKVIGAKNNAKLMLRTPTKPKQETLWDEHHKEVKSPQSILNSDDERSSVGSRASRSSCIEILLNDVLLEVSRANSHVDESNNIRASECEVGNYELPNISTNSSNDQINSSADSVQSNDGKICTVNDSNLVTNMSTEKKAEELCREIAIDAQCSDPSVGDVSEKDSNITVEPDVVLVDQSGENQERADNPSENKCEDHVYANGFSKDVASIISGDIPGTVPITKEMDATIVKRLPSPPNEFIAHRLRREQEQRELDERKARIAAILAKSRDLSSGTPLRTGETSPPRGQNTQDLLKRLASNGNLPSLQKLVALHASESAADENPAPQAI